MYKLYSLDKTKNPKRVWDSVKGNYDGLRTVVVTEFKAMEDNRFHAIFSTTAEDRDGDVIEQNFDIKNFAKNPVFLDSHRYDSIQRIIGKVNNVAVINGKLQGDVEFALDNELGLLAAKLVEKGFLNATSIGFIPREFDEKGNIVRSEILEISAVGVPSNPEALFEKGVKQEEIDEIKSEIKKTLEDEQPEEESESTPEAPESEDEPESDPIHEQKSKNQIMKEATDNLVRERIKALKKINRIVSEYSEKQGKRTPRERKDINKVIRRLLENK